MPLAPGTHLGSYEIVALLGSGGMGEVYRARDTKLGRDVAVKTLPHSVATDAERIARFRREAQVLAALNHPHIGSIYGLEESNGQHFLVLELIDGETLAARIRRGPLPVSEALAIAREIAEALEAAHDKGIIHRDLKPANIALTANDRVKVLDFGLAKAVDATTVPGSHDPAMSPTITSPALLTGIGVILGTAAYMSPEQAKGRSADKRSDVWAFGCVLYEMLTGRRAFEGEDVSDTLAAVLRSESAWNALPPSLPPAVRSLLQGCLEKNPRERIGDLSTARFVLKQQPSDVSPRPRSAVSQTSWILLLVLAAAAGAGTAIALKPRPPVPGVPVTRFGIPVPDGQQLTLSRRLVAVSPDGTRIVFVAGGKLHLRSLSDPVPRLIPGADPGIHPVFSPDGESLLYWSDPALKRIPVTGGVPVTICETKLAPLGIDWTESGIVFVQPGTGIMRVSPKGGTPTTLVELSASSGQIASGVQLLPDGDSLLFSIARLIEPGALSISNFWDKAQIVTQSIGTGQRKTLIEAGVDARFLPSGHLIYMSEGTMMAVPFDPGKLEVTDAAVPVLEGIRRSAPAAGSTTHFAVSNSGVLVYVPGPARAGQDDIFIYDRKGVETALKLPRGSYGFPRVSPDGKWIAFETTYGRQMAIALYDLSGASSVRRLTIGGNNRFPLWSRDGKHVGFQSDRDNDLSIWWQPVDGGVAERLTRAEPGTAHVPEAWSPQDDLFLFGIAKTSGSSLWTFSMRDRTATAYGQVTSAGIPTNAAFSADGRWVAYQVGDSGAAEGTLYVQPFPATGVTHEIGRGGRPMWSRDGKDLFFVPAPSQFLAVTVQTEPTFGFTNPVPVPRRFALAPPPSPRPYDILPDGRIVTVDATRVENQGAAQVEVVLNWFEDLKRKVPTSK